VGRGLVLASLAACCVGVACSRSALHTDGGAATRTSTSGSGGSGIGGDGPQGGGSNAGAGSGVGGSGGSGAGADFPSCLPANEAIVLAPVHDFASAVASSTHDVVWLEPGIGGAFSPQGRVLRTSKCGGAVTVMASGQAFPWDLRVVDDVAYWIDGGTSTNGDLAGGSVMSATMGGEQTVLAMDDCRPWGFAVDGETAFWSTSCEIRSLPLSGQGSPTPILGWSNAGFIAIDQTYLYFMGANETLNRVSKLGGGFEGVAQGQCWSNTCIAIAVDSTNAYWWNECGAIAKAPKSGGPVTEIGAASSPYYAVSGRLALDATKIYWATADGIWVVDKTGGEQVLLWANVDDGGYVGAIAADDDAIYWSAAGNLWAMRTH